MRVHSGSTYRSDLNKIGWEQLMLVLVGYLGGDFGIVLLLLV